MFPAIFPPKNQMTYKSALLLLTCLCFSFTALPAQDIPPPTALCQAFTTQLGNRFDLFPNPTSGQFQVKAMLPIETSYSWQLSDVMGKTLMQGEMKEQQMKIQIASLATGMYHLVMISPEGKRYLMKVVKQ